MKRKNKGFNNSYLLLSYESQILITLINLFRVEFEKNKKFYIIIFKTMKDLICPNCKKTFKVDEAVFAELLKEELREQLNIVEKEKENAVKLAESNIRNTLQEELTKKESELSEMKSTIDKYEVEKKFIVTEAIKRIEKELDDLAKNLNAK